VAQKLQLFGKTWRKSCNYSKKDGAKVASLSKNVAQKLQLFGKCGAKVASLKVFVYNNVVKRLK
jgi:hypothetical protein